MTLIALLLIVIIVLIATPERERARVFIVMCGIFGAFAFVYWLGPFVLLLIARGWLAFLPMLFAFALGYSLLQLARKANKDNHTPAGRYSEEFKTTIAVLILFAFGGCVVVSLCLLVFSW